jgi:hypothetical protein
MTLDKARELVRVEPGFAGGYGRNSVRLILGEVQREHGQAAGNGLIREQDLAQALHLAENTGFSRVGR